MTTLLSTKLFIPPRKPGLVQRARLTQKLDTALTQAGRLILVSAPAGYGKSTLVSEWIHSRETPQGKAGYHFGWFTIDREDNDSTQFWSYFISAFEKIAPGLHRAAFPLLQSLPSTQPRALLTLIINHLAALEEETVLVLDDYHTIENIEIQEGVSFLLDHLPPQAHLVIATRADPALPLARLRARGQALILRAGDLRFTADEIRELIKGSKDLAVGEEEIAALEARTEGWAAGVQMATLALESLMEDERRKTKDGRVLGQRLSTFIRDFSGSQRYILDYLAEEVLNSQSKEVQAFLLQTSFLERMCAPLCNAVLDDGRQTMDEKCLSSIVCRPSSEILDYLERSNLFLIPLDDRREWYRYHHLFADLLQARLRQTWPERLPGLHLRASGWFEENGWITGAIQHALASQDVSRAAALIEQHIPALLGRGELHTLLRWIKALPADITQNRPWLAVNEAWTLALAGQLDQALELANQVEIKLREPGEQPAGDRETEIQGQISAIRAYAAVATGKAGQAIELARRALQELPAEAQWIRGQTNWSLGYACRILGEVEEAARAFQEVIRLGSASENMLAVQNGSFDLAMIYRIQGRLREATALYEKALEWASSRGAGEAGFMGRMEAGLASVLYEQNRLDECRQHLEHSFKLNESWRNPNHEVYSRLILARLLVAEGDPPGARKSLDECREICQGSPVVPFLTSQMEELQVRLWLALGEGRSALEWADRQKLPTDFTQGPFGEILATQVLAVARSWLAQAGSGAGPDEDRAARAVQALDGLVVASRQAGLEKFRLEALILRALAAQAQGHTSEALAVIKEAQLLAEPEGYVRVFLDEGEALGLLMADFVAAPLRNQPSTINNLIEPLSGRELQVLHRIAAGCSNHQIAAELVLSVNTVKRHTSTIYGKLGVSSRTQALAKAQELGLISNSH